MFLNFDFLQTKPFNSFILPNTQHILYYHAIPGGGGGGRSYIYGKQHYMNQK